jgi:hypothetical protein
MNDQLQTTVQAMGLSRDAIVERTSEIFQLCRLTFPDGRSVRRFQPDLRKWSRFVFAQAAFQVANRGPKTTPDAVA